MSAEPPISDLQSQLDLQKRRYEANKKRVSSPQSSLHDLRTCFQRSLNKLLNLATRDVAVKECRNIIEHNLNLEALKVFISCLADHKKNKSPGSREQEVGLLGYTAKAFSEKLLGDTTMRLSGRIAELIRAYFKDLNRSVHEAAAAALCEVYVYAVPKQSAEVVLKFMFEPLVNTMAAGVDVKSQLAAAVALFAWVECLAETDEKQLIGQLHPRVVQLFLRLRPEFPDLIGTVGLLVDSCGFRSLIPELFPILTKLQAYIGVMGQHTQMMKIEACKLLRVIGRCLHSVVDLDLGRVTEETIALLQEAKIDKLPAVQQAVRDALKEWEMLRTLRAELVRKSNEAQEVKEGEALPPLIAEPTSFRALRELVKRKKSLRGDVPEEKFSAQWGLSKAKFLEKGSGNYVSSLGHGKVDVNRALNSRQSVRDYVKSRPMSAQVRDHLYAKDGPTDLSLRSSVPHGANADLESLNVEGSAADHSGFFEESKVESGDMMTPQPPYKSSLQDNPIPESLESSSFPEFEHQELQPDHSQMPEGSRAESVKPFVAPRLIKQSTPEEPDDQKGLPEVAEKVVANADMIGRGPSKALHRSSKADDGRLPGEGIANPAVGHVPSSRELNLADVSARLAAVAVRPKLLTVERQEGLAVVELRKLRSVAMNVVEIPGRLPVAQVKSVGVDPQPKSVGTSVHFEEVQAQKKQVRFEESVELPPQRGHIQPPQAEVQAASGRQVFLDLQDEFQTVVESLQDRMEEGLYGIETQLYHLDARIEDNQSKIYHLRLNRQHRPEPVEVKPVKSEAHISVQTMKDTEMQTEAEIVLPAARAVQTEPVEEALAEPEVDHLSKTWLDVLGSLERADLEEAYLKVLDSSDDLYLLRLMHLTRSCLSSLSQETGTEVLRHTSHILNSGFVSQLGAEWITGSLKAGVFRSLDPESRRKLLRPLAKMEDEQSAQLYKYISKKYCA